MSAVTEPCAGSVSAERATCTAVVVTYNSSDDIDALLTALDGVSGSVADSLALRVVVVDNASTDDTIDIVEKHSDVTLVKAGGNLGYSAAINIGRRHMRPGDALLVLNPDLTIDASSVTALLAALTDDGVGVAVPQLIDDHGRYPSLRRDPSVTRAVGDALFGAHVRQRPAAFSEIVYADAAYTVAHDIDWATGAVFAISAECDALVGDWDERFFLYSEETDYCARVRGAGLRVRFVPTAFAYHRGGGSGGSAQLAALMAVNRVRYFEKGHGRASALLFRSIVVLHHAVRWQRATDRTIVGFLVNRQTWSNLPAGTTP